MNERKSAREIVKKKDRERQNEKEMKEGKLCRFLEDRHTV